MRIKSLSHLVITIEEGLTHSALKMQVFVHNGILQVLKYTSFISSAVAVATSEQQT